MCVFTYVHMSIYVCIYICAYERMYVYTYVCVRVYVHIICCLIRIQTTFPVPCSEELQKMANLETAYSVYYCAYEFDDGIFRDEILGTRFNEVEIELLLLLYYY
jgi:hypothetical protein